MITNYMEFIKEVSGTELVGPVGPAYGETGIQNKTINTHDTYLIYSDMDGLFYTIDEYDDLYNQYLKSGGTPLQGGFNKENINKILMFL